MRDKLFLSATAMLGLIVAPLSLQGSILAPTDISATTRLCTDYTVAGVGSMRLPDSFSQPGSQTATINFGGGLTALPGSVKAYLYWYSISPANYNLSLVPDMYGSNGSVPEAAQIAFTKQMTVNGTVLNSSDVTLIGMGYGNNWPGAGNSYAHRADISHLVTSPNGSVVLSNFAPGTEGASLVVFL